LSEENVSTALMNVEGAGGAYTLEQLLEIFESSATNVATRIGMLASVDIEIVGQVRAGELLRYRVEQTRVLENLSRFSVQAFVEAQVVAHGTIVGAQLGGIL
jgi:3-hydroxymyristoyl/3-hydroxydecanoyl-(acyl carrier protein) dehydratase